MPCYCHHYRWPLLRGWDLNFNYHYCSQTLSNSEGIISNTILIIETFPSPILVSLVALLSHQIFIIIERENKGLCKLWVKIWKGLAHQHPFRFIVKFCNGFTKRRLYIFKVMGIKLLPCQKIKIFYKKILNFIHEGIFEGPHIDHVLEVNIPPHPHPPL